MNLNYLSPKLFGESWRQEHLGILWGNIGLDRIDLETPVGAEDRNPVPKKKTTLGRLEADLGGVYRAITRLEISPFIIHPEYIETICVFGSVLSKNFPQKPTPVGEYEHDYAKLEKRMKVVPSDLDIMVLLKKGISDEAVIIPARTREGDRTSEKYVNQGKQNFKKKDLGDPLYAYYVSTTDNALVKIDVSKLVDECKGFDRLMGLHVAYRSVDQFVNGIGQGDWLSEEVAEYGVALINKDRFEEIVEMTGGAVERKPLHEIILSRDFRCNLNARIL